MMNQPNIKIIFWGTPSFAAIILKKLIKTSYQPSTIITAPDKPVGRKQILIPSPTKQICLENNITILQPEKIKNNNEFRQQIADLKPDLFIVAAYGLILPKEILDLPKFGAINVHPSLLPKYRGPSPIQTAILNGDEETGVTLLLMDEQIDHGPIIKQKKLIDKASDLNYQDLEEKLAYLSAELLIETLPKWLNQEIQPALQNDNQAIFTKIIQKKDGHINWQKPAQEITRMVLAYSGWPQTWAKIVSQDQKLNNKILKILKARSINQNTTYKAGQIFLTENKKIAVACQKSAIIFEEIQLEGKNKTNGQAFFNGYPEIINAYLA